MFAHILVATDGSELADGAVSTALRLAGEQHCRLKALLVGRQTLEVLALAGVPVLIVKHA